MSQPTHSCRLERLVSRHVAGELGRLRAGRVRRHLTSCGSCRGLASDLQTQRAWSSRLGGLEGLAGDGFISVSQAVSNRLRLARETPAASGWRPMWPVLAPLAGVLLMGAVLILGGGRAAGPGAPDLAAAIPAASEGPTIHLSTLEDVSEAMVSIQNGPNEVHRVAVSSHDPRFLNARVFQVQGDRWIDPTPLPAPGQVVFYRVD